MINKTTEYAISIKEVSPNDIDRLIELRKILLNGRDNHYSTSIPEEQLEWQNSYRKWLKQYFINNDKDNIIIVGSYTKTNILAGCAIGIVDKRVPMMGCLNGMTGWIQTMCIDEEYRKQNLGRKLAEFLFNWFDVKKINKVLLQTTNEAKEFYSKLGMKQTGEDLLYREIK